MIIYLCAFFFSAASSCYCMHTKAIKEMEIAIRKRDRTRIATLLQAGVSVNGTDSVEPIIHTAALHATPDIVAMLVHAGADVEAKNTANRTTLEAFIAKSRTTTLSDTEMIRQLCFLGATISPCTAPAVKTAFEDQCLQSIILNVPIVQEINDQKLWQNALILAIMYNRQQHLNQLLERHPPHLAVIYAIPSAALKNNITILTQLLKYCEKNANTCDCFCAPLHSLAIENALYIARARHYKEIEQLLNSYLPGAKHTPVVPQHTHVAAATPAPSWSWKNMMPPAIIIGLVLFMAGVGESTS